MGNITEDIDAIIAASSTVGDFFRHLDAGKEVRIELPSVAAQRDRQFVPALPWRLFTALAPLPGKALAVYLMLWRRSRVERNRIVSLTSAVWAQCGLTRRQKALALACLERQGLITMQHCRGKNPQVTLRTVDELFSRQEPTP